MTAKRLKSESSGLFASSELIFEKAEMESSKQSVTVDPELSHLRTARQRIG